MTNLIMPGEFVRLLEDVSFDTDDLYQKWAFMQAHGEQWGSRQKWPNFTITIPAGTVFKVGSYRVTNNSNPRYNNIKLLIVDTAEKLYLPKSRGGTGRRINAWIPCHMFNGWKIERIQA